MKREALQRTRGGRQDATQPRNLRSPAMEVMSLVDNPTVTIARLGRVVASDRALADRVLRIANSPVLAIPRRVSSLDHAITLLGFNALREMVIKLVVTIAFRRMVDMVLHYEGFWDHSVSCGVAARMLAGRCGTVNTGDAFVAGLFHDIGFLLVLGGEEAAPATLHLRALALPQGPAAHAEVGAWLCRQWNLGEQVADAIQHHHAPGGARVDPTLAAVVHVADVISYRLDIGKSPFDNVERADPDALALLGLREADLRVENLQEAAAAIRRGVAEAPSFESMVVSVKNALLEEMGALPERERLVLALHFQEGLDMADIARVLRVPEEEVLALEARALARLTTVINDCL